MASVLLYVGSAAIALWGVGHLLPTARIVAGFGPVSTENVRILTMEWLAEGITLCFVGILVALSTALLGSSAPATDLVARTSAGLLLVLAAVSALTGARTSVLPMKLCPVVKTVVAALFLVASAIPG